VVGGLLLIADKLYKRNPKEWKKAGRSVAKRLSSVCASASISAGRSLNGCARAAAALAFAEPMRRPRRGAGLRAADHGRCGIRAQAGVLRSRQPERNEAVQFARNMDVAVWKLGHDRNAAGELFLLSNELDPANRNLSFEREFGRVMGLLDFMAKIVADRNGRGLSRLTHSVVSTVFLPVSFLK
jgi:hypothetical protein